MIVGLSRHIFLKFCKNRSNDVDGSIEMISDITNIKKRKLKIIEDNEIKRSIELFNDKQQEFLQNERYKHNFRASILRCTKEQQQETFYSFMMPNHIEKCILMSEFPLNYSYKNCSKYKKLTKYLRKKGIKIKNNAPIKSHREPIDVLTSIYIRYEIKKRSLQ